MSWSFHKLLSNLSSGEVLCLDIFWSLNNSELAGRRYFIVTIIDNLLYLIVNEIAANSRVSVCRSKFDTLIQTQARELSHLRQRLREGRGVCSILTQHLVDTTKAFEELLRANDIDYYMGQSFREQLAQGSALAQRVGAKISGRESDQLFHRSLFPATEEFFYINTNDFITSGDQPEDPDEKTELLAIRSVLIYIQCSLHV